MRKLLAAAAALSAAGLLGTASAATLTAEFDTGAEGFTAPDFILQWQATGGNPDGYLRLEDDTGGFGVLFFGPALVVPLEVGGTISFDATLFSATGGNTPDFGELTLSGGGFTATVDMVTGVPPTGSWQTYSVGLDAATFGLSTGDFATMLANIDGIELVIESTFGINEVLGFDNFRVSAADAVPVPAAAFLFASLAGALAVRRRMAR
ncbi:MAG: hypothetical protein AAGH41_03980 [Pseudomonadota bacterium]